MKVSESTANVQFILFSLPKNWGKGFKLVTSDGLVINDSPGTQGTFISLNLYNDINLTLHLGVQFWKGRKVYAVNKCGSMGKERSVIDVSTNSESGSEDDSERRKKPGAKGILRAIDGLLKEVVKMSYPSLYVSLKETFKCNICLMVMSPPITYSKCCRRIIGYESCVARIYRDDRHCPLCRHQISPEACIQDSRVLGCDELLSLLLQSEATPEANSYPYHVPTPPHGLDWDSDSQ